MNAERVYSIISLNHCAVTGEDESLLSALLFWPDPACEAFGVESSEEANVVAIQTYSARFFGHPAHYGRTPMQLPRAGEYFVAAPQEEMFPADFSTSVPKLEGHIPSGEIHGFAGGVTLPINTCPPTAMEAFHQGGVWSMVALNACAVTEKAESVARFLADETVIYPHAVLWDDVSFAIRWTNHEYAKRLAARYDVRDVYMPQIPRPLLAEEKFVDELFEEREKARSESAVMQKLREVGII